MSEGIGNFITENAGGLFDLVNNAASMIYNNAQSNKARSWQEMMWNKQNDYNLPINQRRRLEDAGINPNLAFGSAASAMSSPLPSSPNVPHHSFSFGEKLLEYRSNKAQISRYNAQTERDREETRRLELANTIVEALLNDRIETERGDLLLKRKDLSWKIDHISRINELGFTKAELANDLMRVEKRLGERKWDLLDQEFKHLVNKYGFEDMMYEHHVNPYETSTPLGIVRTVIGVIWDMIENWSKYGPF